MQAEIDHIATIEDFLGPGEGRFFGEGFKRVTHRLTDVRIGLDRGDRGFISAQASVAYPPDWSRKSRAEDLRPHLSSIDAVVLAVQVAEAYLAHVFGLDAARRSRMWLRRLDMWAGANPQEDLRGFDVHGLLTRTGAATGGQPAAGSAEASAVSALECTVGTITVCCEIAHAPYKVVAPAGQYSQIEDLLGDGNRRYYGNGYKLRSQIVRHITVDSGNLWARADVRILPDQSGLPTAEDLGASYQPAASMIDFLIPVAQLVQVLLYRTDHMDRSGSNTLWMRRVVMTASTPQLPTHADAALLVSKSRLLELDSRTWRLMDATTDVPGLRTWSSCAHELPAVPAWRGRTSPDVFPRYGARLTRTTPYEGDRGAG